MTTVEQAWLEHQKKLYSTIRSRVDTAEDAEDILNDVFVSLIIKIEENDTPRNLAAWLYRVSRNRIVDYYRAKMNFEELPEEIAAECEDTRVMGQLSRCLLPMIRALPEIFRQPLIRSKIEGKRYRQVADELGLSLAAVKSRILRGRVKLHKSMLACCRFYPDSSGNIMDYDQKRIDCC